MMAIGDFSVENAQPNNGGLAFCMKNKDLRAQLDGEAEPNQSAGWIAFNFPFHFSLFL